MPELFFLNAKKETERMNWTIGIFWWMFANTLNENANFISKREDIDNITFLMQFHKIVDDLLVIPWSPLLLHVFSDSQYWALNSQNSVWDPWENTCASFGTA